MPSYPSPLDGFPSVVYAEREAQHDAGYHHRNRDRVPAGTIVIQQTHSGRAILTGTKGARTVDPGQAMIFVYGESTEYRIDVSATQPYELSYIVLRPQGGIAGLIGQIRQDFGDVILMTETGEASRHLMTLVNFFQAGENPDLLGLAGVAYPFLVHVYREQVSGSQGTDPVAYLRHTLQSQFRNQRNIKEWMHEIPLSREHMTRVFHQRYGETPAAYLRRLRLEFAELLARSSNMNAGEIASASGFVSAQTLRRAFRQHFGRPLGSL